MIIKMKIFFTFFEKLDNIINSNKDRNILIHCTNSVSRSVTLVLYYLLNNILNQILILLNSY
jgi:protein-tyrosine phosphatase